MKKNKTISIMMVVLLVISFSVSIIPQVGAATEGEIEASIVLGLEWLAGEQQIGGHWRYMDGIDNDQLDIGTTGIVLLKFCDRAKELGLDPFDPGEYEYATEVKAGFNYTFINIIEDADGIHVDPLETFYEVYTTGCLMMAIASSNAPGRLINTGPLTGETYEYVLQGMMDWMAFAQIDSTSPCEEGGWGYVPAHYGYADNSVSGYATLGIGFAAAPPPYGFGLTIPPVVLTQLDVFIDIVQDVNGGSIYRPCEPWAMINILKTGNLLYEMALVGDSLADARVQHAIAYIEDNWGATGSNPDFLGVASLGWMDCYQAMFTMMKGLVAFGITELENGGPFDWFDVVSTVIVNNQNALGYFEDLNPLITEGEESTVLRTAWALLALEKFIPPQITVTKDFRYTSVDFTPYHWEDPDGTPDTGDEFWMQDPAILGGLLPMDADGNYLVDVVTKKNGKVASTNPGQLYGVISITGPVHEVYIEDDFDKEFDINPAHYGGGIEVIIVDPEGYATVITAYPGVSGSVRNEEPFNDALISINLDTAIGGPLPPGHTLMVYVKFKTAMKHQLFPDPLVPYDFEFWNRPRVWINNEPYVDDPIELEAIIELSIK